MVESASPVSGGSDFPGRELAALEQFVGQAYVDAVTGSSVTPSSSATAAVQMVAYDQYHGQVYAD